MHRTGSTLLALVCLMAATGCGGGLLDAKGMSGADLSQGGIQDMMLARDIIEQGGIPGSEHFASEGLFSEHDLAIAGDACEELLCPRAAMARVQTVGSSEARLLAQLGFATNIDLQSFERDSLDLVVAVDISGSMQGEKIGATRAALRALVGQLDEGDRLGIVTFDDRVSVRSELIAVDADGRRQLLDRIDGIETDGGTWIEGGLQRAFEMADAASPAEGVSKRVMLLTDAQPNVGATGTSSFLGMARSYADRDIGLTSFGVGMDLGHELASELARIRGGNSYTLGSVAEIRSAFDDGFDFMVTPLAYDLEVVVTPSAGLNAEEGYGVAVDPDGDVGFGAATLFLSNKGGGMGIALVAPEGDVESVSEAAVSMSLSFEAAGDGERTFDDIEVALSSGETYQLVEDSEVVHAADDGGVFTMAVLIDELAALDMGASFCDGEQEAAAASGVIRQAADRLEAASAQISEESLQAEAQLMRKLADNVDGGASNCW